MSHIKPDTAISNNFVPPMRDGVGASCVFLPKNIRADGQTWFTVYDFLLAQFPQIAPQIWQNRIAQQLVFDDQSQFIHFDTPYQQYRRIYYYRELVVEHPIPFQHQILYANDHLLVVDKPHFLPVSPVGQYVKETLQVRLKQQFNNPDITPIHRLDRETAGVMLFSLQPATRHLYQTLFQERQVQKTYQAIARHQPDLKFPLTHQSRLIKGDPFFTMQEVAGEPNSLTQIKLGSIRDHLACYKLTPVSGKQHQLRVHMASLGMPILNDRFYPIVQAKGNDDYANPLQLLASTIEFIDPVQKKRVQYSSTQTLIFD